MNKYYFTKETEDAIVTYNSSTDFIERNILFNTQIKKPLEKIIEALTNKYSFPYINSGDRRATREDTLSFLVEKLNKYSQEKGKAFSYFTIVARNYLINRNNKEYKHKITLSDLDNINPHKIKDISDSNPINELMDFTEEFFTWMDTKSDAFFVNQGEKDVYKYFRDMFINKEYPDLKKDKMYFIAREELGLESNIKITAVIIPLRKMYKRKYKEYLELGYFNHASSPNKKWTYYRSYRK